MGGAVSKLVNKFNIINFYAKNNRADVCANLKINIIYGLSLIYLWLTIKLLKPGHIILKKKNDWLIIFVYFVITLIAGWRVALSAPVGKKIKFCPTLDQKKIYIYVYRVILFIIFIFMKCMNLIIKKKNSHKSSMF